MSDKTQPLVSIIIPTLNCAAPLVDCLWSIRGQKIPIKDRIEVLIVDGGSSDSTIHDANIFHDLNVKILYNPDRIAEYGKAIGVQKALGKYLAFIDSDNILPDSLWLWKMMKPLEYDNEIGLSEPFYYTYRERDGAINRYLALMGMADPLCYWLGTYDRWCQLSQKWTDCETVSGGDFKPQEFIRAHYAKIRLGSSPIPTFGANGCLMRRSDVLRVNYDPFFDVDVARAIIDGLGKCAAKVDCGVVHLTANDWKTFYRKQRRRVKDYLFFTKTGKRRPLGPAALSWWKIARFVFDTMTIVPLIAHIWRGMRQKRDLAAWSCHIPACWCTLVAYSCSVLENILTFRRSPMSRKEWGLTR